ncbi:MAG TPA: DUF1559 domain-containing protein [Armatimonadota bacterium]|nr:DUF1559 domain-containing protein [Armatimonadota bacterium]
MLVVIAIIAILAAILFPVFARARENARKANCLSNCKQIATAFMQYTQDYDGVWPSQYWDGSAWQPAAIGYWKGELMPYMKNDKVFICPSTSFQSCSYVYNMWLQQRSESDIQSAADMVAVSDGRADFPDGIDWWTYVQYTNGSCRIAGRHMDGANFVFCDGHAKWQAMTNWKPSQWNPGWTP